MTTYAFVGEVRVVKATGNLELAVTLKGVVRGIMPLRTALETPARARATTDALKDTILRDSGRVMRGARKWMGLTSRKVVLLYSPKNYWRSLWSLQKGIQKIYERQS